MDNKETLNNLLNKSYQLVEYLNSMRYEDSIPFTDQEIEEILAQENLESDENYLRAIESFKERNAFMKAPKSKRFIVYWGYPGAGKSCMADKLIDRFGKEEDCLPFNTIDKDQHRNLFPNLFKHLKNGHIDECEKFADVTIRYVREILDLSLKLGNRSVLSIGSMGAGNDFTDNALKAIDYGYRPCAVYMSVNPDIAYLSNVYRCSSLYDKIIFQNKELYPRLVSNEYFKRVVDQLPNMIDRIDRFQQEHSDNIDLMVINRSNQVLYDSRHPHELNVKEAIYSEENRELTSADLITLNKQLTFIEKNMRYRYENNVYAPCKSEVEIAKTAVANIINLVNTRCLDGHIIDETPHNTPDNLKDIPPFFGKDIANDR